MLARAIRLKVDASAPSALRLICWLIEAMRKGSGWFIPFCQSIFERPWLAKSTPVVNTTRRAIVFAADLHDYLLTRWRPLIAGSRLGTWNKKGDSLVSSLAFVGHDLAEYASDTLLDQMALSAALSVSPRTLRRMVARSELPPGIPLGRRKVWRVRDVLDYLASRADNAAKEAAERFDRMKKYF